LGRLVDDDDLFCTVLAIALDERGRAVTRASDGETGVKLFFTAPTDLEMPEQMAPPPVRKFATKR